MSQAMVYLFLWELVKYHPVFFGIFFALAGLILFYLLYNCCERIKRKQRKNIQEVAIKEWLDAALRAQKKPRPQPEATKKRSEEEENENPENQSKEETEPEAIQGTSEQKKTR